MESILIFETCFRRSTFAHVCELENSCLDFKKTLHIRAQKCDTHAWSPGTATVPKSQHVRPLALIMGFLGFKV